MAGELEIEQKFRVTDLSVYRDTAMKWQAQFVEEQIQVDQYFSHPIRDFGQTDEALRLRSLGDRHILTYKGPTESTVVDGSPQTKTRLELEVPLANGLDTAITLSRILQTLSFQRVRLVKKTRSMYRLQFQVRQFEICLDQVEGLGDFVEIETLASADEKQQAQFDLCQLAASLGLVDPEPRSYLEMLMEQDLNSNS